jgi:Txe/YoeB family toxin of Txe-Axe toxin-antitoxin module
MNSIDKINKVIETLNTLSYKIIGEEEKLVDVVRGIYNIKKRKESNLLIKMY